MIRRLALLCLIFFLSVPLAPAQESTSPSTESEVGNNDRQLSHPAPARSQGRNTSAEKSAEPGVLSLLPRDSTTEHQLRIGKDTIAYTATAGTIDLFGQTGERSAAIFYTAYVAKGTISDRPITFVFNGGPGAAAAFLHLGLVGPKILDFGPTGRNGADARLVDNPDSWLQFTDLVLIDPVGTGWSRAAKASDAGNFYGVSQDSQALAKVIALYVARTGRTSSPKYLFGESYGGFRAAKVAQTLRQDQGLIVSGIVMLSPLLEGALTFGGRKLALGAALELPSFAAAELEHRKAFSKEAMAENERFALTDYLTIMAGPAPAGDGAQSFYLRLSQITGLPVDIVTRARGFIHDAYVKHARQNEQAIVSSYDASFAAPDPFPETDSSEGRDPILDGFVRAFGGAFSGYARDELGFKTEMTYTLLAMDVNGKWDWGKGRGEGRMQASVSDDIRELLSLTPSFRLMIANGYSDLVTPYGISKYVVEHLPPTLSSRRVELKIYRGGHMLYTNPASRAAFTEDVRTFFTKPPANSTQ